MKKEKIKTIFRWTLGIFNIFNLAAAVNLGRIVWFMRQQLIESGTLWVFILMPIVQLMLGVAIMVALFRTGRDKNFVQQEAENGSIHIAVTAIDELVRKCVATHDEMELSATKISNTRKGLVIDLTLSLASDVSIPLAVAGLQKQMKQYITASTGLDVHGVCVVVNTADAKDLKPTAYVMPDMLGKTEEEEHATVPTRMTADGCNREEEEALHQRLFGTEEQPTVVPVPPVSAPEMEAEAAPQQECAEEAETAALTEEETNMEEQLPDIDKVIPTEEELANLEQVAPMEEVQC